MTNRAPLHTRIWPLDRSIAIGAQISAAAISLSAHGNKPFLLNDQPNPRGPQDRIANRTHLDNLKLELRGKDTFFSGPGMGPDYDYPNPGLRIARRQDFQAGTPQVLVAGPAQFPTDGQQLDQPNPRGPQTYLARDFTAKPPLTLAGQDQFPTDGMSLDQPNPRGRPPLVPDVGPGSFQALSFVAPQTYINRLPLVTPRWAPPIHAAVTSGSTSSAMELLQAAPPTQKPFAQNDWPVPRGLPRNIERLFIQEVALVGQDFLPPGLDDWPNPRVAVVQRQDFISIPFSRPSVGPMPFGASDWPNPRGPQARNLDPGDGALTTLPYPTPFFQSDWPLTGRVPARTPDAGYYPLTCATFVAPPFVAPDLQNPQGPRGLVRDFWAGMPRELVGQDALPPGQDDWSIHRPVQRFMHDVGDIGLSVMVVVQSPFAQWDWPNPVRRTPAQDGFLQRFNPAFGQDVLAFRQSEWPLTPAGRRAPQDFSSVGLTFFTSVPQPFGQDEWPVPRGATPRTPQDHIQAGLALYYPAPFSQSDFPNPRGAQPRNLVERLGQTPLSAQIGAPFALSDWPNPTPRRHWSADVGPISLLFRVMPFPNRDWPNPRGAQFPTDLRWTQPNPQPQGGTQPFNYTDWWPGRAPQRETVAFAQPLNLSISGPGAQIANVRASSRQLWFCTATSVWSGGRGTWPGMSTPTYPLDTQIALQGVFTNAAGLLVDPSAVTCRIVNPLGRLTIYSGVQITRVSVGVYSLNITPSVSGSWYQDWQGVGAAIATSGDDRFNIARSVAIRG